MSFGGILFHHLNLVVIFVTFVNLKPFQALFLVFGHFLHLFPFFASTSCFCKACQQIGISRPQISVQPNPHFADFCSFEVRFQILTQALETLDVIELTHPFTIMLMPDKNSKCWLRKDFEAMGVDAVKVGRVILTQRDICARKAGTWM